MYEGPDESSLGSKRSATCSGTDITEEEKTTKNIQFLFVQHLHGVNK